MRNKIKYITVIFVLALTGSCKSYLEEDAKSLLTAQYLQTQAGVNSALNSSYSDLRYLYGNESGMVNTCSGTDEWQIGPGGSSPFYMYASGMSADGSIGGMWNWGYTGINTANGVIKYAPLCGMSEANAKRAVAEAKYIRATWYFMMVQTFGDCPLNLDFISVPSTEAHRDPSKDVYAAIVADLEESKLILPAKADQPGRITAAAAYHLLAKVYLAKATHATAAESGDYQNAYNNAMELINNSSKYGLTLLPDFADVFKARNEHNSEVIFTVERNTDILFNDAGNPSSGAGYKANIAFMLFRPNYPTWVKGLIRDILYGRPWHRVRPTNYLLEVVFKASERYDDSRYDKTFQTVWKVNDAANVANKTFVAGDTAAWLPGIENPRAAKALVVYKPSQYYGENGQTNSIYPSMRKYDDTERPDMNESSVRPFIVHRFAETYLISAEAAMYLNHASEAVTLINVVRDRAAYNVTHSAAENALAIQRMRNKVPVMSNIDEGINFILDERSRELCGEYMRWWDLVRTRTSSGTVQLLNRIRNLSPAIPVKSAIKDFHVLRPIPQSQIDLTSTEFLNNPGY